MNVYAVNIQAQGKTLNVEIRGSSMSVAVKRALDRFSNLKMANIMAEKVAVVEYGWAVIADVPNSAGGHTRQTLTVPMEKAIARAQVESIRLHHPEYDFVRAVRQESGVRRIS